MILCSYKFHRIWHVLRCIHCSVISTWWCTWFEHGHNFHLPVYFSSFASLWLSSRLLLEEFKILMSLWWIAEEKKYIKLNILKRNKTINIRRVFIPITTDNCIYVTFFGQRWRESCKNFIDSIDLVYSDWVCIARQALKSFFDCRTWCFFRRF